MKITILLLALTAAASALSIPGDLSDRSLSRKPKSGYQNSGPSDPNGKRDLSDASLHLVKRPKGDPCVTLPDGSSPGC